MSGRATKPGSGPATTVPPTRPGLPANISPDDPSIPVLTERLTLPPLDLDLDFTLPPLKTPPAQSAPSEPAALEPQTVAPPPLEPDEPDEPEEPDKPDKPDDVPAEAAPLAEEPMLPAPEEPALPAFDLPPAAEAGVATLGPLPAIPADPSPATTTPVAPEPQHELTIPASLRLRPVTHTPVVTVAPLPMAPPLALDALAQEPDAAAAGLDEVELREAILVELANSLPQDVESIVRQQMEVAIDRAIKRFAADVRMAIAASIREILDRAVKAELERRRNKV
ncbi:MAG TPA: hypothetical protein VFR86_31415 [Burkholderiaceae bacterium]|nr:hypothetical protein [Burkholderiaceae bacterium]